MTRTEDAKTGRNWPTLLIGSTFLIPGLAISGWSMYSYMRESTNAPIILCAGASAAFDGIGLFAASKAHAFASAGRKAKFAWLIVWLAVFASVLINWRHASTQHWNQGIHVLISAPAAAAAAAFELMMQETREIERSQHEKRVRTRQSVKIDADIWIHHPFMVWTERRRESAQRLRDAIKAGRPADAGQDTVRDAGQDTVRDAGQDTVRDAGQDTAGLRPPAVPHQRDETPADVLSRPERDGDSRTYLDMTTTIALVDAALDAAEPPAWAELKKADAVRRFDEVLPGYSPRDTAAVLATRGVTVDAAYVRKIRRERPQVGGARNGTVVPLPARRGA